MQTVGPRSRARLMVVSSLYPTRDRPEVGPFVARRVAGLRRRGIEVVVIAAPSYRASALRRHARMLVAALRPRGRIDGVESHVLYPAGLIGLAAATLRRRPLVVYAHGADVGWSARRGPLDRALASLVARHATAVVTNSAATAERVAALGAVARVIPPGVDLDRFRPQDRASARSALGLPQGDRIALYVGTLSRRKGADVFADALDRVDGWTGIAVGDGELRASLAARRGLRIVGAIAPDEVPAWMAAADVVVVPSRDEPLGLAAVEALACGIPVVATAVGGLREVVRDGFNGRSVAPGDPAAIAAALGDLETEEARARLAGPARASIADFDVRTTDAAMAALWAELGVES